MNLKNYIQGKRHGKEANKLERDAMNDPFLQDAIDGFDSVQGDHLPVIEELESKFHKFKETKTLNFKRIWIFGIAASLLFIIGIGTILRMYNLPVNELAQQVIPTEKQDEIRAVASKDSSINVEVEIKKEKTIAQNITRTEKQPTPLVNDEVVVESIVSNETENLSEVSSIQMDETMDAKIAETIPNQVIESSIDQNIRKGKVSGLVLDEAGEPLVGVSVKFKNSLTGTVTDTNGQFELEASKLENDKLIASYIGFEKKEIPVSSESAVIQLKSDNLALNEVVVVGYGKQKNTINNQSNKANVVYGRAAGVDVKQISDKENTFGEYEFKKYFENHRNQSICGNKPNTLTAVFFVDVMGKPTNIKVTACSCNELENEFMRLISISPAWSKVNKNVYITIRLK
ncbi:MAG TPA: carboxypeptidase-like regulatory domain-containing protein [Paludibacter sp.]|nr:carboxypeptidase-like regulatory domain-containing protein [Paludibacter sp.]